MIHPDNVIVVVWLLSCVQLFCDPMDYSPPGSSAHGISQARILELVVISFSRGSSQPKEQTHVSCIASGFFTTELPGKPTMKQYSVLKRNGLSRHKKTWRILKCLLLCDRSPCDSNYMTFYKRQTAAAAKLLQPCRTLCNPIDSSPPGSSVPGILQARTLEWVAISFSNA